MVFGSFTKSVLILGAGRETGNKVFSELLFLAGEEISLIFCLFLSISRHDSMFTFDTLLAWYSY